MRAIFFFSVVILFSIFTYFFIEKAGLKLFKKLLFNFNFSGKSVAYMIAIFTSITLLTIMPIYEKQAITNYKNWQLVYNDSIRIYKKGEKLLFEIENCNHEDTKPKFFVHILKDNKANSKIVKQQDFYIRYFRERYSGNLCQKVISLPKNTQYIRTGQYIPNHGRLWDAGVISMKK